MLGPEGVLNAVLAFAADVVPASCARVAAALSDELQTVVTITPPAQYAATDLVDFDAVKAFPLLVAQIVSTPSMREADHDPDDWTFVTDNVVHLHVFYRSAKAKDVPGAELGRNRLMRAVGEAFLLDPSLGGGYVSLARRALTSRFDVYERDTPGRIISPGVIQLSVQAEEHLAEAPLAVPPITATVITQTLT